MILLRLILFDTLEALVLSEDSAVLGGMIYDLVT